MDSLDGMLEFSEFLKRSAKNIDDTSNKKDILQESGDMIAEKAVESADNKYIGVHSGLLSNTGSHAQGNQIIAEWKSEAPNEVVIGWTSDAFYGHIQEVGFYHHGSGNFIKNPHLRPAFEEIQDRVFQRMIEKIGDLIK